MAKVRVPEPFRHSEAFQDVYNVSLKKYQGLLINMHQNGISYQHCRCTLNTNPHFQTCMFQKCIFIIEKK